MLVLLVRVDQEQIHGNLKQRDADWGHQKGRLGDRFRQKLACVLKTRVQLLVGRVVCAVVTQVPGAERKWKRVHLEMVASFAFF